MKWVLPLPCGWDVAANPALSPMFWKISMFTQSSLTFMADFTLLRLQISTITTRCWTATSVVPRLSPHDVFVAAQLWFHQTLPGPDTFPWNTDTLTPYFRDLLMETPNLQTLFPGIYGQSWLLRQISILFISSFVDINDVWDRSSHVFPQVLQLTWTWKGIFSGTHLCRFGYLVWKQNQTGSSQRYSMDPTIMSTKMIWYN